MANDIQIVIKAVDNASAELNKVKDSLKGLGGTTSGLGGVTSALNKMASTSFGAVSSGLSSIASGLKSIASQAVAFTVAQVGLQGMSKVVGMARETFFDFNDEMKRNQISFETMFDGSEKAARGFVNELDKFNEKTPFEFADISNLSKQLLNAGIAAKDVIPDMTAIGDAVAASGRGNYALDHIVTALTQIKMLGKLEYQDLKQLNQFIPASQILATQLKLTGDQITRIGELNISADKAIGALVTGINQKYGGLMERLNNTISTQMSTLKDNFRMIFSDTSQPLYDDLVKTLKGVNEWAGGIKSAIKDMGVREAFEKMVPAEWKKTIADTFNSTVELFKTVKATIFEVTRSTTWAGAFSNSIKACADALRDMSRAASSVLETLNKLTMFTGINPDMLKMQMVLRAAMVAKESQPSTDPGVLNYNNNGLQVHVKKNVPEVQKSGYDVLSGYASGAYNFGAGVVKNVKDKYDNMDPFSKFLLNFSAKSSNSDWKDQKGGGVPSSANSSGADKVTHEINRIKDAYNQLNQKILEETSSTYQLGTTKISDELDKMQREIIEKAQKSGIDTSALEGKMKDYAKIMTEPITRAWRQAWADMRNETALVTAKMLDDKRGQAEAEFQITAANIEKQKREKLKALGTGNSFADIQAQKAVTDWAMVQTANAKKEQNEKDRQTDLKQFDDKIALNQSLVDLHKKSQGEINEVNRQTLVNEIAYIEQRLQKEKLTDDEILELRQKQAAAQASRDNTPTTFGGAWTAGLRESQKSFGDFFSNMKQAAMQSAQAMQQAFSDFFFDAMTGKLKSLSDYLKSFLESVARAVSDAMAKAFSNKLIESFIGGIGGGGGSSSGGGGLMSWIGGLFGFKADGGPVYSGKPYVVGERGPEIFMPSGNGNIIPNHALAGGGNSAPVVNVYNNTGTQAKVKSDVKFDGKKYVVGVWLDALVHNEGGLRDLVTGMR